LQYVGRSGYIPKPIECKAKTADTDVGQYRIAGLVIDPGRHPGSAFQGSKHGRAVECWQGFAAEHGIGPTGRSGGPYAVDLDKSSQHYGCVTLNGRYIHGDYDLYDIILLSHPRGNLAAVETLRGQRNMRGPRWTPIMRYINQRIHSDMVQHGGQAQYADHSDEIVDGFGPHGDHITLLNEQAIRSWYRDKFQRAVIDTSQW
jgi:hypothetical protein